MHLHNLHKEMIVLGLSLFLTAMDDAWQLYVKTLSEGNTSKALRFSTDKTIKQRQYPHLNEYPHIEFPALHFTHFVISYLNRGNPKL